MNLLLRATAVLLALSIPLASAAAEKTLELTVSPVKEARTHAPVVLELALPNDLAKVQVVELTTAAGEKLVGQLTAPSLLATPAKTGDGETTRELHFLVPQLAADTPLTLTAKVSTDEPKTEMVFEWKEEPGKYIDLVIGKYHFARYMCEALDESTGERRSETFKVYHHVYDPRDNTQLTKGRGGLFPHHRGIFYGFNRITYGDGQSADIWHCHNGVHQAHSKVLASEAGPVLARQLLEINWNGKDKKPFAVEQRELTFYQTKDGMLVEFASRLTPIETPIKLDGDPQHAGFQFRASREVAEKTPKQTYYIRPDGQDKPGSFRQGKEQPWNALSFVIGDHRYTCCYLDHPTNPKPSHYSERDYGRFGSYFVAQAKEGETIDANYRLWIQRGEMTVEQVAGQAANFAQPLEAAAK